MDDWMQQQQPETYMLPSVGVFGECNYSTPSKHNIYASASKKHGQGLYTECIIIYTHNTRQKVAFGK